MKFSIITPTYKRPELLHCAIASLLAQQHHDWEMIIVNDSPDVATYSALRARIQDQRITFLTNEQNQGVNFSRNRALDTLSPSSEWVIFLDDDDQLAPDALTVLTEIHASNPHDWIVTARGKNTGEPLTTAPYDTHHYSYAWDYLIAKKIKGDATHCIAASLVNGTRARLRFPSAVAQAEEWLFYFELSTYTQMHYEHSVTTYTEGYYAAGLNFRRRGMRTQLHTVHLLLTEGRRRNFYIHPLFWLYIGMRVVRSFIA